MFLAQLAASPDRSCLTTQAPKLADIDFVNARDRTGAGPWQTAKGEGIARSVDDLHSANGNLTKQTALTEKGLPVSGRTENPKVIAVG